jgi:NDP-sugar pyrophosphorylase family protein
MGKSETAGIDAIILAGGLGTRLRSVTGDSPKSLASVAGRPFLEYVLAQLVANGIGRAVVCTGFMSNVLEAHFGNGDSFGIELAWSVEDEPRGTGGALKLAEPALVGNRWLLTNGDSLFDISLRALIDEHAAHPAQATLALARVANARRYGRVTLADDGTIAAFDEKADIDIPGLINSGLYIIERGLLAQIPADRPVSLEREVIAPLAGNGVRGVAFDGFFIDIGIPEDFERAQEELVGRFPVG